MGPISGLLWLAGPAVAVVGRFLPGAPQRARRAVLGLVALTVAYAVACIMRAIPWERVSIGGHALAIVALQPLVVAALWLTGGADAYLGPVLVLPMLYVAYFFPARYAWPLTALEIVTYASPLRDLVRPAPPARRAARRLRGGLRRPGGDDPVPQAPAGRRRAPPAPDGPRRPAHRPRRTAARSTRRCTARWPTATRFTLLLADVDSFKQINDRFGHTTGDRVLRELAAHASAPSARATAWPASAATSSRSSPRAPAPRPPAASPMRCARPAPASTPATARSP